MNKETLEKGKKILQEIEQAQDVVEALKRSEPINKTYDGGSINIEMWQSPIEMSKDLESELTKGCIDLAEAFIKKKEKEFKEL